MNLIATTFLLIACSFSGLTRANTDTPPSQLFSWGESGVGKGQFNQPHGIDFDSVGNAHIADMLNNRIQIFNVDGQFIQQIGTYGRPEEQHSNSLAIAVGSNDSLYLADTGNNCIVKYDWCGDFVLAWGGTGAGNGQFRKPTDITIDSMGHVPVTDQFNDRVQKFDSAGVYLTQWGGSGNQYGEFNSPEGIAVDSLDNVYVTEFADHRVQKFSSNGEFIATWGGFGTGQDDFFGPAGIALDSSDNVYIAEENNERIQSFCVLQTDRRLQCWVVGLPRTYSARFFTYEKINSTLGGDIESFSLGANHACAIDSLGAIVCEGSGEDDSSPGQVPVDASEFRQVSTGRDHSCSIAIDKQLMCWGDVTLPLPPAPTDLEASIYSGNTVELFWSSDFASTTIVGFEVYRDNEFLAFTSRHSYLDEQVDLGHSRRYAVYSVTGSRIRSLDAPIVDIDLESP